MSHSLLDQGTRDGNLRSTSIDDIIKSPVILFHAVSKQWFDIFPDEVTIDLHKVVFTYRIFFDSKKVVSIPISSILTATCTYSLFSGTLNVEVVGELKQPAPIEYLHRNDAMKAERIINGLIICNRQRIDLSLYKTEDVIRKLVEIGGVL